MPVYKGHVDQICTEEQTFWATVYREDGTEIWEVHFDKIDDDEREYLAEGAFFDLQIDPPKFKFVFNKIKWTQEEIDRIHEEAQILFEFFTENKGE